jgi:hypothetical protein
MTKVAYGVSLFSGRQAAKKETGGTDISAVDE